MRNQKRLTIGIILIAIILMAIGYAAITSSELTIQGSAEASANTENFKVYFTGANTVKSTQDSEGVELIEVISGPDTTTATVNFKKELGLNTTGDSAYAILEIYNGSNEIDAESVKVTTAGTDTDMFDFEAVMCDKDGNAISDYSVASGEYTYVKVSVTLKASPTDDTSASLNVVLTATAAETK